MLKSIVATFQTVMGSSISQQSAVEIISQWRLKPSKELIFDSGRRDTSHYLEAVARLQQSGSNDKLISVAMDRLRAEFTAVLRRQTDRHRGPISTTGSSLEYDSTAYVFRYDDYPKPEPPSDDVITYLRNIAERMNASNKLRECVDAYKNVRKSFLQEQLRKLHFDERGLGSNQKCKPDELRLKMEIWVQVSKICVKILFDREKWLCGEIFQNLGDGAAKDECFVGTVKDFAVDLFGFAEKISSIGQPYDRMEAVLCVYDAFLWVFPSANKLFLSENGKWIRDSIAQTLSRIENDVWRMMNDFQNVVYNEVSDVLDRRGGVHRSTEHVMEQINVIARNKELLTKLIKKAPSLDFGDLLGDYSQNRGFLELHLVMIIEVLHKNLEKKYKRHEDPCLGQVFMMNNVRHILQKIEGSKELKRMLGDRYLTKLDDRLKFAMTSYQAATCNRFLNCFREKGLYSNGCFKSRLSKTAIKRRINAFNAVFDEIKVVHSSWIIPDLQLRDDVCVSMSAILVPAYQNFLEKFEHDPETKLILDSSMKHSIEDFEALVLEELFADNEVYA